MWQTISALAIVAVAVVHAVVRLVRTLKNDGGCGCGCCDGKCSCKNCPQRHNKP
ncbi:MAG: hypothetical protein IJ760_08760 [Bacteroidales bacterium]|nr:hypothetical protein [Bacteroidales bacterium]